MVDYNSEFILELQTYFGNLNIFTFSKGRVGLYAVLKALEICKDDEIILPGYTCLVVPTAGMVLGAKCKYIDIDPCTYNIDPTYLDSYVTYKTKAIIVQHTYGIPCNMNQICEWASSKNIPIIEDCCLAFGSTYNEQLCGTFGIASYFSGQWNKPFSTGLGGMLVLNKKSLVRKVQHLIDKEMICPSLYYRMRIWIQMMLHDFLVNPESIQRITSIYRILSKFGFMIGSSSSEEYEGELPSKYFMGMTNEQAKRGIYELARIDKNINHRRKIADFYNENLPKAGIKTVKIEAFVNPVYVRYPVRVKNKKEILDSAYNEKIEIGSWFDSPLHPEGTNLEKFNYKKGSCPEAEKATKEVINLPTHPKITFNDAKNVIKFLEKNAIPI